MAIEIKVDGDTASLELLEFTTNQHKTDVFDALSRLTSNMPQIKQVKIKCYKAGQAHLLNKYFFAQHAPSFTLDISFSDDLIDDTVAQDFLISNCRLTQNIQRIDLDIKPAAQQAAAVIPVKQTRIIPKKISNPSRAITLQ
jgi:hypothetical protein